MREFHVSTSISRTLIGMIQGACLFWEEYTINNTDVLQDTWTELSVYVYHAASIMSNS